MLYTRERDKIIDTDEGYRLLAAQVVRQACSDYLSAKRALVRLSDKKEAVNKIVARGKKTKNLAEYEVATKINKANSDIDAIISFFHSEWFSYLSSIDPDFLLEALNKRAEDHHYTISSVISED